MNCITISQLWRNNNKPMAFKAFVTQHNEGKLDAKYYGGQKVCGKKSWISPVEIFGVGLLVLGTVIVTRKLSKA